MVEEMVPSEPQAEKDAKEVANAKFWSPKLHQLLEEFELALRSRPKLALLVKDEFNLPAEVRRECVVEEATLQYFDVPCRLLVLALKPPEAGAEGSGDVAASRAPAFQLVKLMRIAKGLEESARLPEGPWMWPLHEDQVRKAVLGTELLGIDAMSSSWQYYSRRVLRVLGILGSTEKFKTLLRAQFGHAVVFSFTWDQFQLQQLWVLAALSVVFLSMGITPASSGADLIEWLVACVLTLACGLIFACASLVMFWAPPEWRAPTDLADLRDAKRHERRRSGKSACRRWAELLLLALPAWAIFLFCVFAAQMGVLLLIIHINWDWGNCIELYLTVSPCDAAEKHGFWGWLAQVAADVLLAILYLLFFEISGMLSEWLANLRDYQYESDHKLLVSTIAAPLAVFERVGFLACLAFAFVPQWISSDIGSDCSDLWLGRTNFGCLQRRLPIETRRLVFERLLKGPFCVAPFIAILMKLIVPKVATILTQLSRRYLAKERADNVSVIARILGLIFAFDACQVGGIGYVLKGWPFHGIKPASPDRGVHGPKAPAVTESDSPGNTDASTDVDETRLMGSRLAEGANKVFEPDGELLECRLTFIFCLLFGPIMPLGVIITLAAKILERYSDTTKMLFVRRRPTPMTDTDQRRFQCTYMFGAALATVGWYCGLFLVPYNDNLRAGTGRLVVALSVSWMILSFVIMIFIDWIMRVNAPALVAHLNNGSEDKIIVAV